MLPVSVVKLFDIKVKMTVSDSQAYGQKRVHKIVSLQSSQHYLFQLISGGVSR